MLSSEKLTERSDLMIFNNPTKMNQQVQALEGLRDTLKLKGEILQVETDIARLNGTFDRLDENQMVALSACIVQTHKAFNNLIDAIKGAVYLYQGSGYVAGAAAGKVVNFQNEGLSTFASLLLGDIASYMIARVSVGMIYGGDIISDTQKAFELCRSSSLGIKYEDVVDAEDKIDFDSTDASANDLLLKGEILGLARNVDLLVKKKILTEEDLAPFQPDLPYFNFKKIGAQFTPHAILWFVNSLANGVHGYKRHSGSIGYGLLWFLFGGGSVGTGLALQQGFGKPLN